MCVSQKSSRDLITTSFSQHRVNMYGGLHPKSNVDRLYLKRENGGRGLMSVCDCIINERNNLGLYAKDSSENFIVFAERELKLKEHIEDGSEKNEKGKAN